MILHCSKCNINWANLLSIDDEYSNEQYYVCPVCHSDEYLEAGTDIVAYICCPFTGNIINPHTGVERWKESLEQNGHEKPCFRVVVGKPVKETTEDYEARQIAAIDAYHESGNDPAAFFNAHKKQSA